MFSIIFIFQNIPILNLTDQPAGWLRQHQPHEANEDQVGRGEEKSEVLPATNSCLAFQYFQYFHFFQYILTFSKIFQYIPRGGKLDLANDLRLPGMPIYFNRTSLWPYFARYWENTGCFFSNCSSLFQCQNENTCSINKELLYNFMRKTACFSFWFWILGGTVKKTPCIFLSTSFKVDLNFSGTSASILFARTPSLHRSASTVRQREDLRLLEINKLLTLGQYVELAFLND